MNDLKLDVALGLFTGLSLLVDAYRPHVIVGLGLRYVVVRWVPEVEGGCQLVLLADAEDVLVHRKRRDGSFGLQIELLR